MTKDDRIAIRLESHVKEALVKAAKADNRSVSSRVALIIEEWLTRSGYLKGRKK